MINYNMLLNKNIINMKPSGIRRFFDIANEMENVISLSIGEPDFKTPWHIRKVGIESLEKGNISYTPNKGLAQLRTEICAYFKRRFTVEYSDSTQTLVTVGGSEAIDLAFRVMLQAGDEVLIPQPSFVCYEPLAAITGATPVIIETKMENDFKLTPEELESHITPNSKLLVLPYPNNPTGGIMRRGDLEAIAKIVKKHNLFVVSDEIYAELTYGKERHVCFAEIDGMKERTVVVSGFSKSFSMTGWRLGYALGPQPIIDAMTKLHQYAIMSAPTTAQYAAIEALKNGMPDIEQMSNEYNMRRRFLLGKFKQMNLPCFEPNGAFYAFPCIKNTGLTSEEFCVKLLKSKHVAVVPGTAFGESGEGFVRVSYSFSIKHIDEAMKRIQQFLFELN
ncbi:aminotransferase [Clostridia bacterium]|nr:aminotransferase [Clostridia bacterium]